MTHRSLHLLSLSFSPVEVGKSPPRIFYHLISAVNDVQCVPAAVLCFAPLGPSRLPLLYRAVACISQNSFQQLLPGLVAALHAGLSDAHRLMPVLDAGCERLRSENFFLHSDSSGRARNTWTRCRFVCVLPVFRRRKKHTPNN